MLDDELQDAAKDAGEPAGVLAVDDEPTLLTALGRLLRPGGIRIQTADSGASAIALLEKQSESIGVVVSDYTMPGMNGAELLRVVRLRWPDITRILLTGNADMASASAAVNDGGLSSLFTKPIQPEEFREAITQALAHHRSLVETRRLRQLADEQAIRLQQWNEKLESLVAERTKELELANGGLRKGMLETVRLLLILLEQRLPHRTGHYKAVARLSGRLAERAAQPADEVRAIQAAALIHDIGLVGLPDALLRASQSQLAGRPEYEEHAAIGQQMLSSVEQLGGMAGWIRHHHERWDGRGYPDRLAGLAIPLASRLIALAAGYTEALAREGGSAGKWRLTQTFAGEFDPSLIALLDDEINSRPSGTAAVVVAPSTAAPGPPSPKHSAVPRGAAKEAWKADAPPQAVRGGAKEEWKIEPSPQALRGAAREDWKIEQAAKSHAPASSGAARAARDDEPASTFTQSSHAVHQIVRVQKLQAGMVLGQTIRLLSGDVLLKEGATLTTRQIERLLALVAEGKVGQIGGITIVTAEGLKEETV